MRKWLIVAAFCATPLFAGDLDRQWKARAFQAMERCDSMLTVMKKKKGSKVSYAYILESAYMAFINPEAKEIVRKKTDKVYAYHLMFILEEGDHGILDVAYLYDVNTEELLGVRVDRLPKNWGVRPDMPGKFNHLMAVTNVFDSNIPGFLFNKKEPFNVLVLGE